MSTTKTTRRKTPGPPLPSPPRRSEPALDAPPARQFQTGLDFFPAVGAEAVPRLNGSFLQGYDRGPRAVESESGLAERFHRERRLRDQARKLVLQAHRNPLPPGPGLEPGCAVSGPELILDDNNLLPFDFLRTGDRLGRAVVKIQREDGAAGTGFLVAPGILLTNHHVLPDASTASGSTASANYETNPPDDPAGRPAVVPLRPAELFVANEDLDFAFCAVRGLDHLGTIPLSRNSLGIMRSEYVNIIQHPGGRPKEIALQDSQVVKADHLVVQYCCDTEPGSSGSPVFNNRWNLVALHHASVQSDAASGGRRSVGADPRLRFLNEGIRLSAIALWLDSSEAHAPEVRSQTARLRSLFEGLDPQAGFFGALGRKAGGRHAAQMVVECYQDSGETIDLAAWAISPGRRSIRDRLADLAWVMAEMGLDLWFFQGLSLDDAHRLSEHLDAHFRLDFEIVPVPDPRGPGVLLVSRSSALQVEPVGRPKRQTSKGRTRAAGPSSEGLRVRVSPPGRRPVELWLRPSGASEPAPAPSGPSKSDSLVVSLGRPLSSADLRAWRSSGRSVLAAASSRSASMLLVPGETTSIESVFLTGNATPLLVPPSEGLTLVRDRGFPESTRLVSSTDPLALRLVLGDPKPLSAPEAGPMPVLDPELERALKDWLAPLVARLAGELRGSSV